MSLQDIIKTLPAACGVYFFKDKDGKTLYIGKAIDIKKRIAGHLRTIEPRLQQMLAQAVNVDYEFCETEEQALILEASLIKENKPKYNVELKDDRSYPYLVITDDEYPRVHIVRLTQLKEKPLRLLGPFPGVHALKNALNLIRKIFPFCTCNKPRRACLYVHLNLCPCPCEGGVTRRQYLASIDSLCKIFTGERKALVSHLEKEMAVMAKAHKFEEAAQLRDKLTSIYTLYAGKRQVNAVLALKENLGLNKIPFTIDCLDIACLAGRDSTGSAVVFKNGLPFKALYRRYRIKTVLGIDDLAMMAEVVRRRYTRMKEEGTPLPDLLMVDGGAGQVSAAKNELDRLGLNIPLIGLAKKNEEIYFPAKPAPLVLPKTNSALQLLQRLRDEAHRFTHNYHLLLRKKGLRGGGGGSACPPGSTHGSTPTELKTNKLFRSCRNQYLRVKY